MSEDKASYRFGGYRLDAVRGMLLDPAGDEVRLRPKPFALLSYLLDHPGRVLGREELMEALWPDVAVTDDSLTQCIGDVRRAFGDRATEILRTVPRRGYMLALPVEREAQLEPEPPSAPVVPSLPHRPAVHGIAILRRDTTLVFPVASTSGGDTAASMARGLGSDLTAELVRCENLRVVTGPDNAVTRGFAVQAEMNLAGPLLRLTVRVSDIVTGTTFWADRLEWQLDAAGPAPVARIAALADAIAVQIGRKSLRRAQQKPLDLATARELVLLGRELHQRGTEEDTARGRDLFMRAAAVDPGYAPAPAWHAFGLMRTVTHGWAGPRIPEMLKEALDLARKSVELEPESALCQSALAFALALHGRWDEAVHTARVSLRYSRIADFGTRTACSEVLAAAGESEQAVRALRETLDLDPLYPARTRAILGRALLLAGRPGEALVELRLCAAHLPEYAPCFRSMVVAAVEAGALDDAQVALRRVRELRPDWVPGDRPIFWFLRRPADVERFRNAFEVATRIEIVAASGGLASTQATGS
jgi:DNA-binding winged helix-turn-helix (wHTH) protein/TolB-like protein